MRKRGIVKEKLNQLMEMEEERILVGDVVFLYDYIKRMFPMKET
jgi:hypothetical protein